MVNSAVESIIIHTFMTIPIEKRDEYLHDIRRLCDTLEQAVYEDSEAEIRNKINRKEQDD